MAKHKRPLDIWTTYNGHSGFDYPYNAWTPVPATGNGYVSARGSNDRGGNFCYVIYDDGQVEGNFHLVSHDGPGEGSRVGYGETIAYVGSTGNSNGNHLHHEVENPQGVLHTGDDYWNYVDRSSTGYVGGESGGTSPGTGQYPANEIYGAEWVAWGQSLLGVSSDGLDGPQTQAAVSDCQTAHGISVDGIFGPVTAGYAYADAGHPLTAPGFPLPDDSYYFGYVDGGDKSISGYYSHSDNLKCWQQRMSDRGWYFSAIDGIYGDETNGVARAMQQQEGLTVDGLIGPATWGIAWNASIK
jgi:peptidoglycan hydrolase-like protein with peptidoglycan-binding domain